VQPGPSRPPFDGSETTVQAAAPFPPPRAAVPPFAGGPETTLQPPAFPNPDNSQTMMQAPGGESQDLGRTILQEDKPPFPWVPVIVGVLAGIAVLGGLVWFFLLRGA
jgi:hypothetical protein